MRRTYGMEKTHLTLRPEALEVYRDTDPLTIYENEDEDGKLSYDITGAIEVSGLDAYDVNFTLISFGLADIPIGTTYEDPEGTWEIVGFSGRDALVKCLASKAVFDDIMSVDQDEVRFFLNNDWRTA